MPYLLTEEEKRNLLAQYQRNVERINEYLPEHLKVSTDLTEITRRLNDPQEQRLYKRSLELREREERRLDLYNQLADENRYLREKGKTYALDRTIQYQFDMSGDPDAAEYNRNVIRNYYLHPEAMVQQEFKKLLTYDPTLLSQIAKANDTENMLVDFYDKNAELCEYAFALKGSLRAFNKELITDELNKDIDSTASSYEMLKTASEMVQTVSENSFFVIPKLTPEQANYLEGTDIDIESPEFYNDVKTQLKCDRFRNVSVKEFKNFFKKLDKDGMSVRKPGGFNTLIATKQENGNVKNVPFTLAYLGHDLYADAQTTQLPASVTNHVQDVFKKNFIAEQNFVQRDFVPANANDNDEKLAAFKFTYAVNLNVPLHKMEGMDIKDIVAKHKGGFFEKAFGTTSKEFKDVMRQVDDFYDRGAVGFGNADLMAQVGQRYLDHKGVKTFDDILKLKGTSRDRALLCYSLVKTCRSVERDRDFARDYVHVPDRPVDIENTDIDNGRPAIVDIVRKEHAIPDNAVLEDHPMGQTVRVDNGAANGLKYVNNINEITYDDENHEQNEVALSD